MGLKENLEDCVEDEVEIVQRLHERPLYYWLKSFAGREIDENSDFKSFISSNALGYALEYIGISPENEQSSLHLSAIFDEDLNNQQSKAKYPTHYESETKSRIQNLNRIFLELKSFFEDHYSQIIAIRPPNSVHITSECAACSVQEFEKLLFLVLGAAIQGTQKQDTIRKIKRFPANIQESLIECIKLIADNPELLNVKSWQEYQTLDVEEQKKIYEMLLTLIRKLILERNEFAQNQLLSDYFSGYMNCDQRRIYESKGFFSEFEKNPEDTRLSSSMRQLREQLAEKSELLQECREELETARNRIQELENEVQSMQQRHRTMKKARDELDVLREGQDKASRLEAELLRMKVKLQETEQIYERVENLEVENRNWQVKHDMLLDQISFLSFEKSSRESSFDQQMNTYNGILDELSENLKDDDDRNFFESDEEDEEEPSVKENLKSSSSLILEEDEGDDKILTNEIDVEELEKSGSTIEPDNNNMITIKELSPPPLNIMEKDEIIERPSNLDISTTEFVVDGSDGNLVASTPKCAVELKSQEVQTPPTQQTSRVKRRKKSNLLNVKRTKNTFLVPVSSSGQNPILGIDELAENSTSNNTSQPIQLYKIYRLERKKGSCRPKKFKKSVKTPDSEKQVVPNIDNEGNEADEELSLSPTGVQRESDLDSNIENQNGTDNDSEIYFVCSPPNSTGTTTPRRSHFGTTTAFPISNGTGTTGGGQGQPRTIHHQVEFDFHPENDVHSNHLTIYSRAGGDSRDNSPDMVHVPIMKISHEVQIGQQTDSDEEDGVDHHNHNEQRDDDDASNSFTFADYNLQLNLRNSSIKPATALINKISTLSANLHPDHNFNNQYSTNPRQQQYLVETSSEDDGSVWYEYGCV